MSLLHLIDLSSVWSEYGHAMAMTNGKIPSATMNQYWVTSRLRSDTWHELLFLYSEAINKSAVRQRASLWDALNPVIQEILISEMLTRIVGGVTSMLDRNGVDSDSASIASNVFSNHLEARNRCLKLMAHGFGASKEQAANLNRLRLGFELWTDYFLAKLGDSEAILRVSHDAQRVHSWHRELISQQSLRQSSRVIEVGSLRCWLQGHWCQREVSPRSNQRLAAIVMAMLRADSFDSLGLMRSSHFVKLTYPKEETAMRDTKSPFPLFMQPQGDALTNSPRFQSLRKK